MVEFHIKFDKKEYIKAEKLKIRLALRSFYKRFLLYLFLTIVCISMTLIEKAGYTSWPTMMSMFLVGLTLSYISITISTHKEYFKRITALADKYEKENMDYKFIFSNEGIAYEDSQKAMQHKWRAFDSYAFYKNYLLIYRGQDIIYVVDKVYLPDFISVQDLLKSKLILRK
ncbi:hypothetical protein [Pedobacter sp. UC225_65]|uniref:hypothetical protein n=1 Tax=Pedobacter sp. UC225_65 TaxID=3350173 RepID=UPI0036702DBF